MKKTKYRRLAAMAASLLCCLIFTVPAYAQSSEPQPETASAPAETEAEPETQNPFTPDGTGTVVDNATDEDGKEFYTITTADESVFYLVIDKQKTSENVYFLNTVTTDDLLPLAEQGKEPPKEVTPEPEPKPTEPVEEVPEPEPEKKDSPLLSLLLIGAVVLAGGGIGYYFKIYKPKHEAPDLEDDYIRTASFALIRFEVGYFNLRLFIKGIHEKLIPHVQSGQGSLIKLNPFVSQTSGFFDCSIVAGEGSEGSKLRCTI